MRTIKFPKMFNANSTNVWKANEHLEATKQSAILTLATEKNEIFGDPYYGMLFKHMLFSQNNNVLRDMVADIVYTQLALFLPQLNIKRNDIEIIQDLEYGKLYCKFSAINKFDYQPNTYNLLLFNDTESAR